MHHPPSLTFINPTRTRPRSLFACTQASRTDPIPSTPGAPFSSSSIRTRLFGRMPPVYSGPSKS